MLSVKVKISSSLQDSQVSEEPDLLTPSVKQRKLLHFLNRQFLCCFCEKNEWHSYKWAPHIGFDVKIATMYKSSGNISALASIQAYLERHSQTPIESLQETLFQLFFSFPLQPLRLTSHLLSFYAKALYIIAMEAISHLSWDMHRSWKAIWAFLSHAWFRSVTDCFTNYLLHKLLQCVNRNAQNDPHLASQGAVAKSHVMHI